jgi:hypothetical protein
MNWRVEDLRQRQKIQGTTLIPVSATGVALPSQKTSHQAAPRRHSATPSERHLVSRTTLETTPTTSEARPKSGPHAGSDGLLLLADSVGIDGRNFHDGVAHPLGEQIQGNAFVERMDGIAVAQAFRNPMRACGDVRLFHDGHDTPPGRGMRPGP